MALYKRNNVWWTRFTAPDGTRIRKSTGTTERKQAKEFEDTVKAKFWRVAKLGEKPRRTWQEAAIRWSKESVHKVDHQKDKAKLVWINGVLGAIYLDEIDRDVIEKVCITKLNGSDCAPSTVNRYLALIRAILRAARDDWEWVDRIPKVKLLPESKRRVRWITPEQARNLIETLPPHLADMAEFSLATGLRQGNVSYLRWDQVSLERRVAWIDAPDVKNRKALSVQLNNSALDVLKRRQTMDRSYVFTYQGNPVARTTTKAWHNALCRAGIADFRWHDLRHTWASWHVQRGTSLQELMELGGWSSYEMVLRYAHLASDHLQTAASRIDDTNLAQARIQVGQACIKEPATA